MTQKLSANLEQDEVRGTRDEEKVGGRGSYQAETHRQIGRSANGQVGRTK